MNFQRAFAIRWIRGGGAPASASYSSRTRANHSRTPSAGSPSTAFSRRAKWVRAATTSRSFPYPCEEDLDEGGLTKETGMAVLRIAKMGNPVLAQVAAPVADPSAPEIRDLAADMIETLQDIGASGLAAPQVFVSKRVVVYRMIAARIPKGSGIEPRPWTVMVNPVITPKAPDKISVWERCLSIPGLHGKVPRYPRISITYRTLEGETVSHDAHSSWAALLQHECDHLDGIVYPMRMTDLGLLAYNEEPGQSGSERGAERCSVGCVCLELGGRWPGRNRWFTEGSGT